MAQNLAKVTKAATKGSKPANKVHSVPAGTVAAATAARPTAAQAPGFVQGVGFTNAAPAAPAAPSPLPTVATPALVAVPATTVAVPAQYMGLPFASLTKSQQSFATAKRPVQVAPKLAAATLQLGTVAYKVRSGNNAHWWQAVGTALAANSGKATAAQMVAAGACPKFVGYAVNRKWLASVPATV
jgi:hypothetical protein